MVPEWDNDHLPTSILRKNTIDAVIIKVVMKL